MSLQVEKLEKNMAKMTIEVEAEELEKAIQSAYLKNRGKYNLHGFRKGKAPRLMIEKMFGPGIFYEEAANILISDAYGNAADESELDIVSRPEIEITQIEKGKPFIFTAMVAVKPEVTLGEYRGLEVEREYIVVSDEDINGEIAKVQEQNSRLVTIEDRAIENGDQAIIDFEGFVDGAAFEGGQGDNFELVIGSHSFIDTFEEQLIGKNIGDEAEVNVTFPEEYHVDTLAGKPALFKVKINGIKVKELPEADDEFASEVSEFDTLDEYKEDIRVKLVEGKEKSAKSTKENKLVDKVIEKASMEIPEAMLELQINNMMQEFSQRMQSQGLTMEQYMQFTNMTGAKMAEQMKPQAEKRIQTRLVLEEIVKLEKIETTEDELNKELEEMAKTYDMEIEKLKSLMGEREMENMKKDLAVQKAVDLILETSKEI